ncbi:MAG: hypothetical protein OEY97_13805 [Nitrospirota bacterium]|nr:hypothetical protein [Nitrospirota bacterium]
MADKQTLTMTHPKAKDPIEVLPDAVPAMKDKGWLVKGEKPANLPLKEAK